MCSRRGSPSSLAGFGLVELLIVSVVFTVIFAVLLAILNTGSFFNTVTAQRLPLQQEARNILGWVAKDVRQTSSYHILDNNPSSNHLKFKLCAGHDGTAILWEPNYIEYTYDPDARTLTRRDLGSGRSWVFANIVSPPFNVTQIAGNLIGITIHVRKVIRGDISGEAKMTAEVKLRNG